MKKPLFSFLSSLALTIAANFAFAVGLGVLEVESQSGEPLQARIPLLDLGDVQPAELQVALASVADYRQLNADSFELLSSLRLQMQIESGADGHWLALTTEQPIPESNYTVILDTSWPGGRILSQHLLAIGDAPAPELIPATTASKPVPAAGGELAGASRQSIRTVSGDSLWRIADRLTGENSENLNRTMLALHRLNPEAFIGGDIDRLRADVKLRMPNPAELGALDQSAARDETARQPTAGNVQPEPLAAPAPQSTDQDDDPDGQLSLVVGEADEGGQGGSDELDQRIAELENELAQAQEEADRVRIEQEELRARLDDLDEQISMARQIIELQEQELAQLQASLAAEAEEQQARQATERAAAVEGEAEIPPTDSLESLLENPVFYFAFGAAVLILAILLVLARVLLRIFRGNRLDEEGDSQEPFEIIGFKEAPEREREEQKERGVEAGNKLRYELADEPEGQPEQGVAPKPEVVAADPGDTNDAEYPDGEGEKDFEVDLDKAGEEEIAERLNLAYSFHKMGDTGKARKILENVIRSGNEGQISEARQLLAIIDDLS